MKLILRITFAILCFSISFNAQSQLNYSFEFEASTLQSNRSFTTRSDTSISQLEQHRSQSKFVQGFYLQAGINLRDNKRTRFYAGFRLLNQNVLKGYFHYQNMYIDSVGQVTIYGFANSTSTDMLYLTLPLMVKQSWISRSNFRMVSEIGFAPGFLIAEFPSDFYNPKKAFLSGEFAMSFEWRLPKGNMVGIKFPALTYSFLPNVLIKYGSLRQYNYSLALGVKFGIGDWSESSESVTKKFKNKHSIEVEIASMFSNNIISFNKKNSPASDQYDYAKYIFQEFSKLESQFLPGGYFQFGINFRQEKRTRFFTGIRFTEQRVLATTDPIEDSTITSSGSTHYFLRFEFEQVRLGYLSIPIIFKQSIIEKPSLRFGFEAGVAPGILLYDFPKPEYISASKPGVVQTEFSLSVEKKFKNGSWIGIKLPSFNYSLSPNIASYPTVQRNYSFGMGIRFIFPE